MVISDQHFLTDELVIARMIELLDVQPHETVLDLGAGSGAITRRLKGTVIAVEKDPLLASQLRALPVTVVEADALKASLRCDKLISNVPFTIAEALMYRFFVIDFSRAVLLLPLKFVRGLEGGATMLSLLTNAFFDLFVEEDVEPATMTPVPDAKMCLIVLNRKEGSTWDRYLRELFLQRDKRVKNALREAHVKISHVTKREAQLFVAGLGLEPATINKRMLVLSPDELRTILAVVEKSSCEALANCQAPNK